MAKYLIADFVFSMLYIIAAAMFFFNFVNYATGAVLLFILLSLTFVYKFSPDLDAEEVSRKYLENEKSKKTRSYRRQKIDVLTNRLDTMAERIRHLKSLIRGEVLVLE